MDDFVVLARSLISVGLALLLVMLRLDAERFGTAEYYEATRDGEQPRIRRRLAWYGLGFALAVGDPVHPSVAADRPLPRLGRPAHRGPGRDRLRPARDPRGGRVRVRTATTGSASRTPGRTRARCSTPRPPRSSTRSRSAARCSACCWSAASTRPSRTSPRRSSTRWRPGSGRPGATATCSLLTLGMGLLGGWLTVATGGIAAAFLGHAITRFAVFLCTGHTGQTKPRGREVEEIEKRRRPPEGWRVIGSRESASRDR